MLNPDLGEYAFNSFKEVFQTVHADIEYAPYTAISKSSNYTKPEFSIFIEGHPNIQMCHSIIFR
jgi:hypothetical protein